MASAPHRYGEDDLRGIYDGLSDSYRWVSLVNDTLFGVTALRRWALRHATGDVLDVACGTGENFRHLWAADTVAAVDLSPRMLARARDRADRLDIDVALQPMSAQALTFPDDSFDTVTSALSTCTFPDPAAALGEMVRVLRPAGRILLVEHGRSRVAAVARFQDRRADAHYRQAGCRWNADVGALLDDAGLVVDDRRSRALGIFTAVVARPA